LTGDLHWAWATPIGGGLFLVGWSGLAFAAVDQLRNTRSAE
jgi:uncharacterized membrane protein YgdD (TMEM256/DUF423 family)